MGNENQEKLGIIKISDDVIAVCASKAALATEGVAELAPGFGDNLSKNLLKKESIYKGIKISQSEERTEIDLFVFVYYGVKIPQVAWDLQENVKREVENMLGFPISAVNIHVQGVVVKDVQSE